MGVPFLSLWAMTRSLLREHWIPLVALLILAHVLVLGSVATMTQLSPIDEAAHFDYLVRFPDPPASGERMTEETLTVWACQGVILSFEMPACDVTPHDPDAFPGQAYNLAGTHPPLYYAVTSGLAHVISGILDISFFTAARTVGAFWLSLLLMACYALAVTIGASRTAAVGATALLAATPSLVTSAATLGPDVATAAVGGILILAVVKCDVGRRSALLITALTVLAGLTKLTTFTAVGVAALILVARAVTDRSRLGRPGIRNHLLLAITMVAIFLAVSLAWTSWSESRSTVDPGTIPQNTWFVTDTLDWSVFPANALQFLTPVNEGFIAPQYASALQGRLEAYATGALVLGTVAAAWYARRRPTPGVLASAVLFMAVLAPALLVAMNFGLYNQYFPVSSRYGFALIPGFVAAAAFAFRGRATARALLTIAILSALALMVQAAPFNVLTI